MTDWAAKVLEGVPRHYDANCDRVILEADALAAIGKLAEGDGLVEQLLAVDHADVEDCFTQSPLFTQAAARIAALTEQVAEARNATKSAEAVADIGKSFHDLVVKERDLARYQLTAAEAEAAALRAKVAENRISEPHDPGDFVGDIFYGHPVKTTMGTHRWTGSEWAALPSEAEALAGLLADARNEAAALRERVARLEGALRPFDACVFNDNGDVTISTGDLKRSDWLGLRAALTDGGKDA